MGRCKKRNLGFGLGLYFLESLYSAIDSLKLFAGIHSIHFKKYYRLLSKRFPFAIYYKIDKNTVTEITQSKLESMIIDRWENIPDNGSVVSNTWALTWLILTWATIPAADADDATKAAVIEVIKAAYINEPALSSDGVIEYVLNSSWESELAGIFETLVLNTVANVGTITPTPTFTCWDTISVWLEAYTTELISWVWWYEECWTTQNMRHWTMLADWTTMPSDIDTIEKWCYDNSSAICTSDWWLYTWAEAMWFDASCNTTSCTQAEDTTKSVCWQLWEWWLLPTDAQWTALTDAWATWWAWNKISWIVSSLPGGRLTNASFITRSAFGYWWSSTEDTAPTSWLRSLFSGGATVLRGNYDKAYGYSVVCIKN